MVQTRSKRRYHRYSGLVLDVIVAVFGILTALAALAVFINFKSNIRFAPIVFSLAGAMDLILAIKSAKRKEKGRFIMLMIEFVVLLACALIFRQALN